MQILWMQGRQRASEAMADNGEGLSEQNDCIVYGVNAYEAGKWRENLGYDSTILGEFPKAVSQFKIHFKVPLLSDKIHVLRYNNAKIHVIIQFYITPEWSFGKYFWLPFVWNDYLCPPCVWIRTCLAEYLWAIMYREICVYWLLFFRVTKIRNTAFAN